MTEELFLLGDVSRRPDISPHHISYLFQKGAVNGHAVS